MELSDKKYRHRHRTVNDAQDRIIRDMATRNNILYVEAKERYFTGGSLEAYM